MYAIRSYYGLTIGGIIAVFAIIIHKELLIPILCGVFLVENLSVILQVNFFKIGKRKGVITSYSIHYTKLYDDFLNLIKPLFGREREKKELAKVFQALRIEVNQDVITSYSIHYTKLYDSFSSEIHHNYYFLL